MRYILTLMIIMFMLGGITQYQWGRLEAQVDKPWIKDLTQQRQEYMREIEELKARVRRLEEIIPSGDIRVYNVDT